MKTLLILAGSLCATTYAGAQEIAPVKTTFEDMEVVLNQAGFESYAYDLSSFLECNARYDVAIRIKEYDGGKELDNDRVFHLGPTRMLLNDFPEEYRAEIPDSVMLDSERGILRESGRLVLGRYPTGIDSVARWVLSLENGGRGSARLDLKAVITSDNPPFYGYESRPFVKSGFESGKFIPLIFFGSMWYDAQYGIFRFCGESEIDPDLTTGMIVKQVPHFYVLGVEFTAKQGATE